MNAKLTLSFNESAIKKAKIFAEKHQISLSRLTEFLYNQLDEKSYENLEELPISDWVMQVAEGKATYKTKSVNRKDLRNEFIKTQK
jgi:hypothetical protein